MGPKERRSSTLSALEEAAIVALRVQARLSLDDVFVALKDVIPHLTRSSLHRCLQRHGISRLPKADREKPKRFKAYEIGYFHIDIAELRHEGGKAHCSSRSTAPLSSSSQGSTGRRRSSSRQASSRLC